WQLLRVIEQQSQAQRLGCTVELVDDMLKGWRVALILAHRHRVTQTAREFCRPTTSALLAAGKRRAAVYPDQPMRLPTKVRIGPQTHVRGSIAVPGSQSITNRAL